MNNKKNNNKKLIINADDYGLNFNVIKSIINASKMGILTSTSIMPTISEDLLNISVGQLDKTPQLDCGVHITLCSTPSNNIKPLCPFLERALKRNFGGYFPLPSLQLLNIYRRSNMQKLLKVEIRKQINRIIKKGLVPSHLNSHYYIGDIPFIFGMLTDFSKEFGIPVIRIPSEKSTWHDFKSFANLRRFLFLKSSLLLNKEKFIASGLKSCDSYYGATLSKNFTLHDFKSIIEKIDYGITEILVHPSLHNTTDSNEREQYEFLISPEIKKIITDKGIILTSFKKEFCN